jgi:tetratricopeptide (TPR) repeat protein
MRLKSALIAALFFVEKLSAAADPSATVIEQAQKLLLEGHRTRAVEMLVKSIKKETQPRQKAKLSAALSSISQQFLTEKGQRLYEAGLTLQKPNPQMAMQRFTEAAAEEDANVLVTLGLAQTLILQKKCQEAKTAIDNAMAVNPIDYELLDLRFRANFCLGDRESANQDLRVLEKTDFPAWRLRWLRGQLMLADGTPGSQSIIEQVAKEMPKFPEPFFVLWRWPKLNIEQRDEFGKKYVATCKSLSVRGRQDFRFEPELCLHSEEVQAEIEKDQKHWDDLSDK